MTRTADLATETTITARRGRASFEELYAAHAPEARSIAFLMVGDRTQAEDIAQEAFVRVLGRFADLRKPEAFRAYLLRTVMSLSKNHYRRKDIERRHADAQPPNVTVPSERDDDLFDALKRLPERQRAALVLRFCEDLSEHQTAEILQTSTKAVKSLVTRGLSAMREEVLR